MNPLFLKRIHGFKTSIEISLIEVSGSDAKKFLQGQTTNDVQTLKEGEVQYNTFLNRQGRIESFFILRCVSENNFQIWLSPDLLENTMKRMDSFIVADDVELKAIPTKKYQIVGGLEKLEVMTGISFLYFQENALLIENNVDTHHIPELSDLEKNCLFFERGFFSISPNKEQISLFNETILSEIAWNHDKGCFLGQEVVQKIYSRRGAAHFPYKLIVDQKVANDQTTQVTIFDKNLTLFGQLHFAEITKLYVLLPREMQVAGLELEVLINQQKVSAKVEAIISKSQLADEIYHYAIEKFSIASDAETAINLIKLLIRSQHVLKPTHQILAEWHESLGAILGKMNRFEDAMQEMKQVAELLPDEVMPYTNLSLYAMKLGRIEEAEKYKEEATLKSFLKLGQESKIKKAEKEKNLTREKMFHDVLAIDEYDAMALCGLAEIDLLNQDASSALNRLKKLHSVDDKYTQSYILLGRAQEFLGNIEEAKKTWEKGLSLAINKGELMPAQQLQSYLHKFSK
jgi:folate-binding Fe-S cluster repair protein YgfZ/Tfp pilus assembly protein PilF